MAWQSFQYYAQGVSGIARSILRVGPALPQVMAQRREICHTCPEALPCRPSLSKKCKCDACGCLIVHKTRLQKEQCPLGKW